MAFINCESLCLRDAAPPSTCFCLCFPFQYVSICLLYQTAAQPRAMTYFLLYSHPSSPTRERINHNSHVLHTRYVRGTALMLLTLLHLQLAEFPTFSVDSRVQAARSHLCRTQATKFRFKSRPSTCRSNSLSHYYIYNAGT